MATSCERDHRDSRLQPLCGLKELKVEEKQIAEVEDRSNHNPARFDQFTNS